MLLPDDWDEPFEIELRIEDVAGNVVTEAATSTAQMRRSFAELVYFVGRENPLPPGTVLLTGTGLVPADEVALAPGHTVSIRVPGIGILRNPVAAAGDLLERKETLHVG